jgi:hypothetical protein
MANLNVFIASFVLLSFLASGPLTALLSIITIPLARIHVAGLGSGVPFVGSYLLIAAVLVYRWISSGLVPSIVPEAKRAKYRRGHTLLVIAHIAVIVAIGLPITLSLVSHNSENMLYMWYSIILILPALLLWAYGLYLVWSSGGANAPESKRA